MIIYQDLHFVFTWRVTSRMSSFVRFVISMPRLRASLNGPIVASFTRFFMSDPEYPAVKTFPKEGNSLVMLKMCIWVYWVVVLGLLRSQLHKLPTILQCFWVFMISLPSVSLQMMFISSSDNVNNPSFCRRFCIIHALASSITKTKPCKDSFFE